MDQLVKEMTAEEQAEKMTAEYAELKASRNPIIESLKAKAKIDKIKPSRKEVTPLTDRQKAERALIEACKEMKISPPRRINAKADSKSGLGALQAFTGVGIKIAVRSNDIVIYMPQSELGFGVAGPGRWNYVTVLKWADPNLDKAFKKALKDKVASTAWAKQLGFVPRTKGVAAQPEDLATKRRRLEAELDAIKLAQGTAKAKAKPKKVPKSKEVIAPSILAAVAMIANEVKA